MSEHVKKDFNTLSNIELADKFLKHIKLKMSSNTYTAYKKNLYGSVEHPKNTRKERYTGFIDYINIEIRALTPDDIEQYLADRTEKSSKKELSHSTRKLIVSVISSLIDFAINNGYKMDIGFNPGKSPLLKDNNNGKKKEKHGTHNIEILKQVIKSEINIRNRTMMLTFLKTGIRIHELANLELSDINFDQDIITVRIRKGGIKNTLIPIDAELKTLLQQYLKVRPKKDDQSLFTNFYGKSLSVSQITKIVSDAGTRVGIHLSSHQFRYVFTALLRNSTVARYLRGDSEGNSMIDYYSFEALESNFDLVRYEYLRAMPEIMV